MGNFRELTGQVSETNEQTDQPSGGEEKVKQGLAAFSHHIPHG
jgi:hypothetical protein